MASVFTACSICDENYDEVIHKPLFLPCGHTFCRSCLSAAERVSKKKCPKCRQTITLPVAQLPVNFALIPTKGNLVSSKGNAGRVNSSTFEECQVHGFYLDSFCVSCRVLVCMKCAAISHLQHRIETEEDVFNKDGRPTDFVLDLRNKIETSVESLEKRVTAADKLLNFINELEHCKEDIQQWKDNLLSIRASEAQDLEAWENVKTQSTEKKCKLFQALPRLWRDDAEAQSYNLLSENTKSKLSELQKVVKTLQEHLPDFRATPVTSDERFDTAERSELSDDDVLRKVLSNVDVRKAFTSVLLERRPSRAQAVSPFKDHMRRSPEVLDNLGPPHRSDIQKRDMTSLQGASRTCIAKNRQKSPEFLRNFDDAPAHTRAGKKSKEHLPDVAAVPVGLGETFGTAERSELLGDDVLWKVSSKNAKLN